MRTQLKFNKISMCKGKIFSEQAFLGSWDFFLSSSLEDILIDFQERGREGEKH